MSKTTKSKAKSKPKDVAAAGDRAPMAPLFSVITVCYNCVDNLRRTLESVNAQTCRLFEHVVVDGGSTDGTVELIHDVAMAEMSFVSEPDRGIYDAMNKGLGRARGEYVVFLNAGDTFHAPDTLQCVADVIMAHDFPGIVYGQTDIVDSSGTKIADRHLMAPATLTLASFAEGMVVCHQAFFVLRRITGPYDLRYKWSADYDWCIHCLQHSRRNVYTGLTLVDYLSEGATTAHHGASLRERFTIMRRHYGARTALRCHISFIPRWWRRRHKR